MPRRGKLVLQIAAVGVVGLLLALLGWRVADRQAGQSLSTRVEAGDTPAAPDFTLPSLDGSGDVTLSSFRGKVVVLNFWASWCLPCRDEAPLLESAWQRWRDEGVVVLGIDAQDFKADAKKFVAKYEQTYPNTHDGSGKTLGHYGITGFPETWFVDREGRLVGERIQGPVTAEALDRNIRLALGEAQE